MRMHQTMFILIQFLIHFKKHVSLQLPIQIVLEIVLDRLHVQDILIKYILIGKTVQNIYYTLHLLALLYFFSLIIEFLQLASFPFTIPLSWAPSPALSTTRTDLPKFQLAFFESIELFYGLFYLLFTVSWIFFIIYCSTSYLQIRKNRASKDSAASSIWSKIFDISQAACYLVSSVLVIPTTRKFFEMLNCTYYNGKHYLQYALDYNNSSMIQPTMENVCWSGYNIPAACLSIITLVFYIPIVVRLARVGGLTRFISSKWFDFWGRSDKIIEQENLHFMSRRSYSYNRFYTILKILLAAATVFLETHVQVVSIIFLLFCVFILALSFKDPPFFNVRANQCKFGLDLALFYSYIIASIVAFTNSSSELYPILLLAIIIPVFLLGFLIYGIVEKFFGFLSKIEDRDTALKRGIYNLLETLQT